MYFAVIGRCVSRDLCSPNMYDFLCTISYNYSCAGALLTIFLISATLNPIIVYYNNKKTTTINTILFQLLAITDFVTNVYIPWYFSFNMIKPSLAFHPPLTSYEIFSACVCCALVCLSVVINSMLGVIRYIMIKHPFYAIKQYLVLFYIGFHFFYSVGVLITAHIGHVYYIILNGSIICFTHLLLGVSMSVVALLELDRNIRSTSFPPSQRQKRKSCVTILIMNIVHALHLACIILTWTDEKFSSIAHNALDFTDIAFVPSLTSLINPVIIFTRNCELTQFLNVKYDGIVEGIRYRILGVTARGNRLNRVDTSDQTKATQV